MNDDVAELVRILGDSRSLAILDKLPIGVFLVGPDGRQLYANAAVEQIPGRSIDAGTSAEDRATFFRAFIAGTNEPYPPDQLPAMRALRGERVHVMDMEVRAPGHRVVIDIAASPIYDSAGNIAGSVSAFHDVTEAARGATAYRALVERVPVGVYRLTTDGDILLANPALRTMLGYSIGADLSGVNLERDHTNRQLRLVFKKVLEERGEVRAFESVWRRRDGTSIHVSQNATASRDESGRIVSYEGIVEDITERKRG